MRILRKDDVVFLSRNEWSFAAAESTIRSQEDESEGQIVA